MDEDELISELLDLFAPGESRVLVVGSPRYGSTGVIRADVGQVSRSLGKETVICSRVSPETPGSCPDRVAIRSAEALGMPWLADMGPEGCDRTQLTPHATDVMGYWDFKSTDEAYVLGQAEYEGKLRMVRDQARNKVDTGDVLITASEVVSQ